MEPLKTVGRKPPNCPSNLTEADLVRELIVGDVVDLEVAQHQVAGASGAMPWHHTAHLTRSRACKGSLCRALHLRAIATFSRAN